MWEYSDCGKDAANQLYQEAKGLLEAKQELSDDEKEKISSMLFDAALMGSYAAMQQIKRLYPFGPKTQNEWMILAECGDLEAFAEVKKFARTYREISEVAHKSDEIDEVSGLRIQTISFKTIGYEPIKEIDAQEQSKLNRYKAGLVAAKLALEYAAGSNKKEKSLAKALCYRQLAKDSGLPLEEICPQINKIEECWPKSPNNPVI